MQFSSHSPTSGSTASAVLDNLASHYGLDTGKLNVVNLPPPEQITSIAANEVQAVYRIGDCHAVYLAWI